MWQIVHHLKYFSFEDICDIFRFVKWLFADLYLTVWVSVGKGTCWQAQCPQFNFDNTHGRRINSHKLSFNFQMCAIAYIQPYSTHTYSHTHNNTNNKDILNVKKKNFLYAYNVLLYPLICLSNSSGPSQQSPTISFMFSYLFFFKYPTISNYRCPCVPASGSTQGSMSHTFTHSPQINGHLSPSTKTCQYLPVRDGAQ